MPCRTRAHALLTSTLALVTLATVAAPSGRALDHPGPGRGERRVASYGQVRNILPPGSNGNATALDVVALGGSTTATPTTPAGFADQLEMYDALTTENPRTLTGADLDRLYKDASLAPTEVVSTATPRTGVTIERDPFGVPFITGTTFANVEFGAGYATVEDRMFLMDVLRHTGQGRLAEFVGNSAANVHMDASQVAGAYYTPAEATAQVAKAARRAGAQGPKLLTAVDAYLDGVNQAQADLCPTVLAPTCPVEYAALQKTPEDWTRADIVYVASLVGGIFGKGGGGEVANARWLQALTRKFGRKAALRTYDDLREKNDPEAPVTTTRYTPYDDTGGLDPDLPGVAIPDRHGPTAPGSGALLSDNAPRPGAPGLIDLPDGSRIDLALEKHGMSNAILVTGKESTTGKPLAVMGPQTGYYAPQLLVEQSLQGPGIAARGVAFAGTNLFVQLGHGLDYAWSATSASNDNIDTVVEPLCNIDGTKATVRSTGYLVGRKCVAMQQFTHSETTTPNLTSPDLPVTYDFLVLRTRHGLVQARATVKGRPVAIVSQRSTYGHEVDSVLGFQQLNDPGYVHDADSFQKASSHIDFTFNWFYADNRDISYFSSGLIPIRSKKVEPDLPHWAGPGYDWQGWLPRNRHPHETNPARGYFVSWNNKPAPGFAAADNNWSYGPVYRSLALEDRLAAAVKGGRKVDIEDMVGVMADAATVDSRAAYTLPWLLRVLPTGTDRDADARRVLRAWLRSGAHRVDRDRDGSYGHEAAIALFDDWWEHGSSSVARTVLHGRLKGLERELPQGIDDHPRQGIGSAWNGIAWYGYVNKELRTVLGRRVDGRYHAGYCARGRRFVCGSEVAASLHRSVRRVLAEQDVTDVDDLTYDKSEDDIRSVTGGLVGVRPIDWQNRPTFQQVVEYVRHRAR